MNISIITPTYNRKQKIKRSIDSSLTLIKNNFATELVIVDDASTDDTEEYINVLYAEEILKGLIVYYKLKINIGATGAKNKGAEIAKGDWVIFMDSDDCFIEGIGKTLYDELISKKHYDALFFRCADIQTGKLIGPPKEAYELILEDMINNGTRGECLPTMKRSIILRFPFPTDLRCGEGLSYLSLLCSGFRIHVSEIIPREYDTSGDDRLCSKSERIKRADKMIRFHYRMLKYWKSMKIKKLIGTIAKIGCYSYLNFRR